MIKNRIGFAMIALAGTLAACGMDDVPTQEEPEKPAETMATPTSLQGATCATLPGDVEIGSWEHQTKTHDCLRGLALEHWPQARTEATHIATWNFADPQLDDLIDTLTRFDSAAAVGAVMEAQGLLGGKGNPWVLEYYGEQWQPLTASDWLLKAGNVFSFDAETGMHPNDHHVLLSELAELFGDPLAAASFTEIAPHWDSEEPYQLHATLGDQDWKHQAENYGDWYDVAAVLDLINEMAADIGIPDRIMALETGDQTVTVIVGPGQALIAAAADGLIDPAGASASIERGKAFEEEVLRRFRIVED